MSSKNPFDFSELFEQMDPTKMAEQFQEMVANSPFANLDAEGLAETQRKNVSAIMEANQAAVSGAQALMQKQSDMMKAALDEAQDTINKLSDTQPAELAGKNAEVFEQAMSKAMQNFNEVASMVQNVYTDVSDTVETRMKENIEELREALSKTQ